MAGDVSIQLDLNAKQLYEELQQVTNKFGKFAGDARSHGESAGKGFSSGFGAGIGTNLVQGIAALGIGNEIKTIVEKFSQIEDVGVRFGVPVEGLQKIANAAEKLGIPIEGVAKAFRFLELARDKALAGNNEFIQKFTQAGLTMEQVKEIHIEDLFVAVGSKSISATDGLKLFGRGFADVRPLAEGLADGTVKFGKALSAVDAKKLKEADDAFKDLRQSVEIFGGGLLSRLIKNFQADIAELVLQTYGAVEQIKGLGNAVKAYFQAGRGEVTFERGFAEVKSKGDPKAAFQKELAAAKERANAFFEEGKRAADEYRNPKTDDIKPRPTRAIVDPDAEEKNKDVERDKEKLADIERQKHLDSLPFEQARAELQGEADTALSGAKATADEKERVELKLKYYEITKQIADLENAHAKDIKDEERQRLADQNAKSPADKLISDLERRHGGGRSSGRGRHAGSGGGGSGEDSAEREREIQELFNDNVDPAEFFKATGRIDARAKKAEVKSGLTTTGLKVGHVEGTGGLSPELSLADFHKQFQGRGDPTALTLGREAVERRKRELVSANARPLDPLLHGDVAGFFPKPGEPRGRSVAEISQRRRQFDLQDSPDNVERSRAAGTPALYVPPRSLHGALAGKDAKGDDHGLKDAGKELKLAAVELKKAVTNQ